MSTTETSTNEASLQSSTLTKHAEASLARKREQESDISENSDNDLSEAVGDIKTEMRNDQNVINLETVENLAQSVISIESWISDVRRDILVKKANKDSSTLREAVINQVKEAYPDIQNHKMTSSLILD